MSNRTAYFQGELEKSVDRMIHSMQKFRDLNRPWNLNHIGGGDNTKFHRTEADNFTFLVDQSRKQISDYYLNDLIQWEVERKKTNIYKQLRGYLASGVNVEFLKKETNNQSFYDLVAKEAYANLDTLLSKQGTLTQAKDIGLNFSGHEQFSVGVKKEDDTCHLFVLRTFSNGMYIRNYYQVTKEGQLIAQPFGPTLEVGDDYLTFGLDSLINENNAIYMNAPYEEFDGAAPVIIGLKQPIQKIFEMAKADIKSTYTSERDITPKRKKILYIDENTTYRENNEMFLKDSYLVHTVDSFEKASQALKGMHPYLGLESYDLILVHYDLNEGIGHTGAEIIHLIREKPYFNREIPIVVIADEGYIRDARIESGDSKVSEIVFRNIPPSQLIKTIERYIAHN